MEPKTLIIHHLVKSEDLNHHRTLFAGRGAEWLVESGFIAAADLLPPQYIVCVKIHGMAFTRPVFPGEIIRFESKIILAGRSRLVAFIGASVKDQSVVQGFITFVYVDENGKPRPHGIQVEPVTEEDKALYAEAMELK
jgi:acyl-CoA hydrolase